MDNPQEIEFYKSIAAKRAIEDNITGNCIIGIGSGSTMVYVLQLLSKVCQDKGYHIQCIPTSHQSKQLIDEYRMNLTDLDRHPTIDLAIDGADEVDPNMIAIKGGGGCLTREKVVAAAAKKVVIVADYRKDVKRLGEKWKTIPIEVLPEAWNYVRHRIADICAARPDEIKLRIAKEKVGPVVTDNGNFILDWNYNFCLSHDYLLEDWRKFSDKIKVIPGVIETGIFAGLIHETYFGHDGHVVKRSSTN